MLVRVKDMFALSAKFVAPLPGSARTMVVSEIVCTVMLQGVVHCCSSQHVDSTTCVRVCMCVCEREREKERKREREKEQEKEGEGEGERKRQESARKQDSDTRV